MNIMDMQERQRKMMLSSIMKKLAKELETVIPVSFYEAGDHRQMFNPWQSLMPMEVCAAFTGKHIFRTTIIIRKNFILRPVIQGFGHLKPDMGRLGLESAGISGFRRRQEAWH